MRNNRKLIALLDRRAKLQDELHALNSSIKAVRASSYNEGILRTKREREAITKKIKRLRDRGVAWHHVASQLDIPENRARNYYNYLTKIPPGDELKGSLSPQAYNCLKNFYSWKFNYNQELPKTWSKFCEQITAEYNHQEFFFADLLRQPNMGMKSIGEVRLAIKDLIED